MKAALGKYSQLKPGSTWGRWTIVSRVGRDARYYPSFRCRCSCSASMVRDVIGPSLLSCHSTSCGCKRIEWLRSRPFENLTGRRFGKLIVLGHAGVIDRQRRWRLKCDCGTILVARAVSLLHGHTRSCGCLRWDKCRDRMETLYWIEKQLGKAFEGLKQARKTAYINYAMAHAVGRDVNTSL